MNRTRKALSVVAIVGGTVIAGAAGINVLATTASAQDTSSTTTPAAAGSTPTAPAANAPAAPAGTDRGRFDPAKGGHVGQNGQREELLTGDTAEKVKAAALAAQPGATIERVETDAEGAAYEAHIVSADGRHVTLKLDTAFAVTATEEGHGPR